MNSAMIQEEQSKLLKRHAHKPKKPYVIESRMPNSGIPAFARWCFGGRYETEAQRDQALHDLRKTAPTSGLLMSEYRVKRGS
ncbi:MAG TPA: hypothetical protein VGH91_05580 [Gammaproteobacteria bacterium]|jgi:hypothetical protein